MDEATRDGAIAAIKAALKARSDRAWSVKGGRGTAWGWITVVAPPRRCNEYGSMTADDCAVLAGLFGLDRVGGQGVSIPAGSDYRHEYAARARGEVPSVVGKPYWD